MHDEQNGCKDIDHGYGAIARNQMITMGCFSFSNQVSPVPPLLPAGECGLIANVLVCCCHVVILKGGGWVLIWDCAQVSEFFFHYRELTRVATKQHRCLASAMLWSLAGRFQLGFDWV